MKLGFLMMGPEFTHSAPITEGLMRQLRCRGIDVRPMVVEHQLIDIAMLRPEYDAYVLKPGSEILLSMAGILHQQGARILNNFPACELVKDKIRVMAALARAGVPVPFSFVSGDVGLVQRLYNTDVIVKDPRGGQGEGIHVYKKSELPPPRIKGGVFGQEHIATQHFDLKVYCIGEHVMATRRPFPCVGPSDYIGTPTLVSKDIERLALTVGKVLGLEIFGMDIIEAEHGYFVVDVNYFPSFVGVLGAVETLTDYIYNFVVGKKTWAYAAPLVG
ncbi:MAG: hypothetical protein OEW08_13175 [Gammaproteobacteria bacterium]|nr:hypothetical protein [Gammaproteobacteria bacterium]